MLTTIFDNSDMFFSVFVAAILVNLLLILSFPLHQKLTSDSTHKIQSIHKTKVPRIGGFSVILVAIVSLIYQKDLRLDFGILLLLTALPSVLFGLLDDLSFEITPLVRFCASIASGLLTVFVFEVWIQRIDLPVIDYFLKFVPIAIGLTVFASITLTHAYNLSDGMNGLTSGYGIISLLTIQYLAFQHGDTELAMVCNIFVCCISGFWVINFVSGRLFLGDGGSYLVGHTVAWLSIMLAVKNPEISPWALFLNTIIPILDLSGSVFRRLVKGQRLVSADLGHIHHVIFNSLKSLGMPLLLRNSMTSLFLLVFAGFCSSLAAIYVYDSKALILITTICFLAFSIIYKLLKDRFENPTDAS